MSTDKRSADSALQPPEAKRQAAANAPSFTKDDFLQVFPKLRDELVDEVFPRYEMPKEALDWIKKVIDYNVPGGKLNRGLTVVHALEAILGSSCTDADRFKAAVLGWCVEWLQAFFLVADDVMDQSHTRRGQECWYRRKDVGLIAINDSFLLQACIFSLLKRHFGEKSFYLQLIELFNETTLQTELGQLQDLTSNPMDGPTDLDRFTPQRHHLIVKYKTAYYSFYLPVALGMILGGVANQKALKAAEEILVEMGEYFQVQDDYLDCYADPEVLGKIGTDIQDNKCSWLVVQALQKANDEQKEILKTHYGVDKKESIQKIKDLYQDMGLEKLFIDYEAKSYDKLVKLIDQVDKDDEIRVPKEVFTSLLHKIYKRQK